MSGVAAIFRFDGGEFIGGIAKGTPIERMTRSMAYRGPDGIHHWTNGPAALGYCAMHATQLDASMQPLRDDPTGAVLVMDGYLANWADLRRKLKERGARLRIGDDAELVLQAYLTWGMDCATHLDGEFACVIWDERERRAVAFRDHHGLRPLYMHQDGQVLIIASEITAILAALPHQPSLNLGYLAEQVADVAYTSDETVWHGIKRLAPAHILQCSPDSCSVREYWTLPTEVETPFRSDAEYFEAYRHMFATCTAQASRSYAPVACEVSGGLDSSAVFAMAHHLSVSGKLAAPQVTGYTLAGPAGTDADEIEFARAVGNHLGVQLREHPLFLPDLDWFAQQAEEDCDMPPLPNAAMSLNLDRAAAADGSRVTLTGIGGDQWLDGVHHYYRELFMARDWGRLAVQYKADVAAMGTIHAASLLLKLGPGSCLPIQLRHSVRNLINPPSLDMQGSAGCLLPELQSELAQRKHRYEASLPAEYRQSYKLRKLKFPLWAAILDQANRQRARAGLEMRSPMMSRAFIEFSTTTPEHIRLRGNMSKYVHRHALSDLLPAKVAWRESKAEFSTVYHRHEDELQKRVLGAAQSMGNMLNAGAVTHLFQRYMSTNIDERYTAEIWGIYVTLILTRLDANRRQKGTDR